jgi:hypothetical protein
VGWLIGEAWCRHLGWSSSGARAALAALARVAGAHGAAGVVTLALIIAVLTALWRALAAWRGWRRPSVAFLGLFTFEALALLQYSPLARTSTHHISPAEWLVRGSLSLGLLCLVTAWGAAPGASLLNREGPRTALGFLQKRQLTNRILAVVAMAASLAGIWITGLPLFQGVHAYYPPGLLGLWLLWDVIFWLSHSLWRRDWRRTGTAQML